MGRKKIQISRIEDERVRKVTFTKRKAGLMKKAMELSMLCDCEVGLIIFTPPPDQKLYKYGSKDMDSVVRRVKAANGPVESVHNADYNNMYSKRGKAEGGTSKNDPSALASARDELEALQKADVSIFCQSADGGGTGPAKRSLSRPTALQIPPQPSNTGPDSVLAESTPNMFKKFLSNSPIGPASDHAFPSPTHFLSELQTPMGTTPSNLSAFAWNSPNNTSGCHNLLPMLSSDTKEPASQSQGSDMKPPLPPSGTNPTEAQQLN